MDEIRPTEVELYFVLFFGHAIADGAPDFATIVLFHLIIIFRMDDAAV